MGEDVGVDKYYISQVWVCGWVNFTYHRAPSFYCIDSVLTCGHREI